MTDTRTKPVEIRIGYCAGSPTRPHRNIEWQGCYTICIFCKAPLRQATAEELKAMFDVDPPSWWPEKMIGYRRTAMIDPALPTETPLVGLKKCDGEHMLHTPCFDPLCWQKKPTETPLEVEQLTRYVWRDGRAAMPRMAEMGSASAQMLGSPTLAGEEKWLRESDVLGAFAALTLRLQQAEQERDKLRGWQPMAVAYLARAEAAEAEVARLRTELRKA